LEKYLECYNNKRVHQGLNMKGRTLFQVFIEEVEKEEDEGGSAA